MKNIIFEKLVIKNFLSVGVVPVTINFKPGLHGITGRNLDQVDRRNGVGKSTIPDAFHFALFGTTLRELKKEFIINNITGKTCEVSLTFKVTQGKNIDSYEIIRTLEPSKCYLYKNNQDITRDSISNTTEYISSIIHSNSEVFQNCVIMTVNNTIPFMAKKKIDKRKFIEGIFNLEVFSRMLLQLREEQSTVKKEFDIESVREEEGQLMLDNLNTQKEKSHKDYESQKKTLELRKNKNTEDIDIVTKRLAEYKIVDIKSVEKNLVALNDKLKDCDIKLQEISKQTAALETKNEFCFTTLTKIGTDRDVCPTCLKPVTQHDVKHIKEKKATLNDEIKQHEKQIEELESKISELNILKTKINDAIKKGQNNINQNKLSAQQNENDKKVIEQLKHQKQQVESDLQHLKDTSESLTGLIDDSAVKLTEIKDKADKLKKVLDLLDTVKFVVSEEGVKSFIVKRILTLFNSKLAYYLKKLNSNAIISFNEYFEEQVFNLKGKMTSYFNFSGAERKVIDLAIMFTFIEMLQLQGNLHYNVQFYDELLDTSLDDAGVELVVELLSDFVASRGFGVYIISHRKECARLCSGSMIFLEKKNGITTVAVESA
jgi:DNA repair exonuclease SbcCD ATPase subunit